MTDTAYLTTTLAAIRQHLPCEGGWTKLLKHLGKTRADNEPLALVTVLDSSGFEDALWCVRAVNDHDREIRLFGVWCARQVQHLMTDARSLAALDVAERYANNCATSADLAAARAAALDSAWDAATAAPARAAQVAAAARAAAWAAAWAAAAAAAAAATKAAAWDAAWDAAADAARAAAWAAAWDAQDAAWDARDAAAALEFRRRFGCSS